MVFAIGGKPLVKIGLIGVQKDLKRRADVNRWLLWQGSPGSRPATRFWSNMS